MILRYSSEDFPRKYVRISDLKKYHAFRSHVTALVMRLIVHAEGRFESRKTNQTFPSGQPFDDG